MREIAPTDPPAARPSIEAALERTFGFTTLRPLQREAIAAALAGRDALVVMPTGGGKSLCYQLPPLITGKLTVVVSPLIALMQDQVDGLRLQGYPAAAVHSNLDAGARADAQKLALSGDLKLLLVAPERLFQENFLRWLAQRGVGAFAIDEAHCISQWGHDFRPEYRRLRELRDRFPDVPCQAYTATATPRVRDDIVEQLALREPAMLVGTFDRPNLTYRVLPRVDLSQQVAEAIARHPDAAAIVYCISRKDTEGLADALRAQGIDAAAYHAGLPAATRTQVSADFRAERLHVVVATVAFGMGIDRGDVRLVVHAAMPKSVEHYQQETGRAGRDGLPAECLLLYSAADAAKWKTVMERGAEATGADRANLEVQFELLQQMQRLANRARCRHRALSEYFGQAYPEPNCGACDFCRNELEPVPDAHVIAQKILSAVFRTGQRFGASYVIDVLRGSKGARVVERGHDKLPTFGLLADVPAQRLGNYIDQLVDAGDLARSEGEYPVLALTTASAQVLRGERQAVLLAPKVNLPARARDRDRRRGEVDVPELSAPERALFDVLRALRRDLARDLGVPPYVVFSDVTLEELARVRPSTPFAFLQVRGVGQKKLESFGAQFLDAIRTYCAQAQLPLDAGDGSRPGRALPAPSSPADAQARPAHDNRSARERARELFARGVSIAAAAGELSRAPSTLWQYLVELLRERPAMSIEPWVSREQAARVQQALAASPDGRLKPVYEALGGEVSYDAIRIVKLRLGLEEQ
jgi:ATP-dependent DNA helicase RecQ